MIEYEQLHHVGLNVTDLEKAKVFYGEVLCLPELKRPPFDFEGAWYAAGSQQIHLLVLPESQTIRHDPFLSSREGHLALRVKSYEQTREWLEKMNIPMLEKPNSVSGFAQIFVSDPDGNLIELHVERNK
ncbi:VOC family protein [Domibacillus enclensis]|uniref:Glyoxalase n=1 Tax=Domibacillus enclensis TaxID=1017273 RepID=A0A1N6NWW2_9BACI|nr:VOC family protein [Domibacillus enclensis]OXS80168.1 glyoxalase [Domibacillus enclensis]SIP96517.1 Glyoxalase/Bleomycin resistance protein/Dioxygenase superfamily protein [Domibacillus enclensis]